MKKMEKLAIVFLVIWVLTLLPSPLMHIMVARLYPIEEFQNFTMQIKLIGSMHAILLWSLNIAVGIVLFVIARREKRAAWVWLLLGIAFGLIAALFLYVLKIHEELKEIRAAKDS